MPDKNPLEMSDEEFAQGMPPKVEVEEPKQEEEVKQDEPAEETKAATEETESSAEESTESTEESKEKPVEETNEEVKGDNPPSSGSEEDKKVEEALTIDYKAEYEKIMQPFKANGKTIELKSPEEVIKLMQQGANYTRKMQAIAPHRKLLIMLENNGLLDENKLNYLIDLEKKNPDAIRQLIKESGIDTMDLGIDEQHQYNPKDYRVTDKTANFQAAIDDLKSDPAGMETLIEINSNWDNRSKELLGDNPELLSIINDHRQSGIYKAVSEEVERRKMLGYIPSTMPFLEAYKQVGNEMNSRVASTPVPKQPIARGTTIAQQHSVSSNKDRVKAAAPTRGTNKSNKTPIVNPLTMSDEEFMKMFDKNRL